MINFRYHIVSIVAIFLALALGIVIGTTALNGPITTDLRSQVNSVKQDRSALADQVKTLQAQVTDTDRFASQYADDVVAGTLKDQSVLILGLPGARTDMKDALSKDVAAAGGTVTGIVQLTADYSDPKRSNDLRSYVTAAPPTTLTLPETDDVGELAAALLAHALLGLGDSTDLTQVLAGFAGLHMLRDESSKPITAAKNVMVVASGSLDGQADAAKVQLALVNRLRSDQAHVVLAGDSATAKKSGIIGQVINDDNAKSGVSTVDNADTALGEISATLAQAGAAKSQVGHYGTGSEADGLFPDSH